MDFLSGETAHFQKVVGLAGCTLCSAIISCPGVAETRRGARALMIPTATEGVALAHVRMMWRFFQREHRRHAGSGPLEKRAPFVACSLLEDRDHLGAQRRPVFAIVLAVYILAIEADALRQFLEEFRLDRTDCEIKPVARFVCVVPRRAAVEDVVAALVVPTP